MRESAKSNGDVIAMPRARGASGAATSLLLAESRRLLRDTLSAAIEERIPGTRVDAVKSRAELVEHLERRPDTGAVIVEWGLPGLDAVSDLAGIARLLASGRMIVVADELEDDMVPMLKGAGVHGAFTRDIGVVDLSDHIQRVLEGECCFALPSVTRVLQELRNRHGLSAKEAIVMRHYLRGAASMEIASCLRISEGTVRNHLSRIHAKVGIRSGFEAYPLLQRSYRGRALGAPASDAALLEAS